jgi:hypothetical protein
MGSVNILRHLSEEEISELREQRIRKLEPGFIIRTMGKDKDVYMILEKEEDVIRALLLDLGQRREMANALKKESGIHFKFAKIAIEKLPFFSIIDPVVEDEDTWLLPDKIKHGE